VAPFGAQWAVGGDAANEVDYVSLRTTSSTSAEIATADGSLVQFLKSGSTWVAEPGAEDLTLTGPDATRSTR
jgi:hypothetical protein